MLIKSQAERRLPHPQNTRPTRSQRPWTNRVGLLIVLLVAGTGATLWWWQRTDPVAPSPQVDATAPLPIRAKSPYLNTQLDVAYVGSASCRECHPDQHQTYAATAHSRSMSVVDPTHEPPDAMIDHSASGRRYHVYRQDRQLRHRELIPINGQEIVVADHPLKYLVGSGRFTRSYLAETDGFLIESPLTWYASLDRWHMSPGFDRAEHLSFHRVATFDCVYCHAGAITPEPGSIERFTLNEAVIGCERCHGPGALHAEKHSSGGGLAASNPDDTIVNPRRLPRALAEAVCHQCHLEGEVRVAVRGRRRGEFRPGLPWQDFYANYTAADNNDMTVTGHVEQLQQSRCYQESDSLTCITCHDVHADTTTNGPATLTTTATHASLAAARNQCLPCHTSETCTLAPATRTEQNQNDCTACHMPTSTTDIPHIAFTHHRIGIHAQEPQAPPRSGPTTLRPILNPSASLAEIERIRMLGLAYFALYHKRSTDPVRQAYLQKAESLLVQAADRGLHDPAVATALAEAADARGDRGSAQRWENVAPAQQEFMPEDAVAALDRSAQYHLQRGDFGSAAKDLTRLTELRLDPGDWFLLGICRQQLGNLVEARTSLERVLEIDAGQAEVHEALAVLLNSMGDPQAAQAALMTAAALRSQSAASPQPAGPSQ